MKKQYIEKFVLSVKGNNMKSRKCGTWKESPLKFCSLCLIVSLSFKEIFFMCPYFDQCPSHVMRFNRVDGDVLVLPGIKDSASSWNGEKENSLSEDIAKMLHRVLFVKVTRRGQSSFRSELDVK